MGGRRYTIQTLLVFDTLDRYNGTDTTCQYGITINQIDSRALARHEQCKAHLLGRHVHRIDIMYSDLQAIHGMSSKHL